jgi:hypothetical protein
MGRTPHRPGGNNGDMDDELKQRIAAFERCIEERARRQ